MSRIGVFDDFSIGTATDDAIELDLVTTRANTIQWLAPEKDLIAGCAGAEISIGSTSTNVFGPSSVEQRQTTVEGSFRQQPIVIDNKITFIQNAEKKILRYGYDFGSDSQITKDYTEQNEEIASQGFKRLAYAAAPQNRVFGIDGSGQCRVYTLATAANSQITGGWTTYNTEGFIQDIATLSNKGNDKVYVLVNRHQGTTINTYLEEMEIQPEGFGVYLDSYKTGPLPEFKFGEGGNIIENFVRDHTSERASILTEGSVINPASLINWWTFTSSPDSGINSTDLGPIGLNLVPGGYVDDVAGTRLGPLIISKPSGSTTLDGAWISILAEVTGLTDGVAIIDAGASPAPTIIKLNATTIRVQQGVDGDFVDVTASGWITAQTGPEGAYVNGSLVMSLPSTQNISSSIILGGTGMRIDELILSSSFESVQDFHQELYINRLSVNGFYS